MTSSLARKNNNFFSMTNLFNLILLPSSSSIITYKESEFGIFLKTEEMQEVS